MFAINVILNVKAAEDVAKVSELLGEAGRLSRTEPGCLHFEVCHSTSDPMTFMLIERWESEQAWQDHRKEKAFTTIYQPQVLPLVDRTPHFCEIVE